jgi:hypothetical protein
MRVVCWSGFLLQGVHQFESLIYDNHHIANLTNLMRLIVVMCVA